MDALSEVADRHHVALVEDAAEAHGARYRDRIVGSLGDVAVFSFFGNKILTTGEGGMVVTSNGELAHRVRIMRGQGQEPGTRYWHTMLGFNYRMTNVAAAIGVAQLERVDWHLGRRQEVARWYADALAGQDAFMLAPQASWARSAHWMVCGTVNRPDVGRDGVMAALGDRGIETRPLFPPLHTQPIYADGSTFAVAEDLAARGVSLPTFATLTRADVDRVANELRAVLQG
jgi:perosamine synthetase